MSKKPSPAVLAAIVAAAAGAASIALMPKAPMPIDHGSDPGVALATSAAAPAAEAAAMPPADAGKEECFGVAKAGENDCAASNGAHTCGGMAKTDYSGFEFKNVDAGTCVKMGGKLEAFDNTANPQPPKAE